MSAPLGQEVRKGIRWLAVAQTLSQLLWLAATPVLARLLGPGDFGLYNTATVALGFFSTIAGLGLSTAVIQRKELSEQEAQTAFWASVVVGVVISGVGVLLGPALGWIYQEPALPRLAALHALSFAAGGVSAVPMALFSRRMRFDLQVRVSLLMTLCNAIGSVAFAWAGFGPESFALGMLAGQLPAALLAWRLSGLPRGWRMDRGELRGLRRFSLYNAAGSAAGYLLNNVDYLAIGYALGKEAHGRYAQAFLLTHFAYTQIMPAVSRVIFSAFARQQDDNEALAQGYLRTTRTLAAVTFPFLAFLAVYADLIVDSYLGARWGAEVVGYIRILAIVGALKCVVTCVGLLLNAKGRADLSFRWSLLILGAMIAAVSVGVRYGVEGVCWAWVAVFVPQGVAIKIITHRLIALSNRRYLASLWPAVALSLGVLGGFLAARGLGGLVSQGSPRAWGLGLGLVVGLPLYGLGLRRVCPWLWKSGSASAP